MKITGVTTYALHTPLAQPFAFSQGWVHKRSATIVEISTDAGINGWGEAFNQGLEPPQISAAAIDFALKPLLLDADPLETEVLWHRMYHQTRDFGRKGSVVAAISAVDIALWDIAGKHYGVPIATLLGGFFRKSVSAYATGFYRVSGQGEAARLAEEAITHYEAGFRAMKVKLGYGLEDDLEVMAAIKRALGSREVTLMADTNHAYGLGDALRLGNALQQYDLRWYEEPVVPEDYDGYRTLREKLDMPIAGGENEHTLYGFRELIGGGCVDVAQPDIGSAGGFSACRHIAALAQSHGVQVNPHVWGSGIAQAASLQLIAALPVSHHAVFPTQPILEYDTSSHPFRSDLISPAVVQRNGSVDIPQGPGLGIEVNRDVLQRYAL
ncbi:MAG: mandelate racemase/muconate lactonizing enzyme family protein [Betaproteobacteria bacterium]|nr:mandelate racemase/muconate lactonizing enzyme family protein [Betaproteobacteria bacterium]